MKIENRLGYFIQEIVIVAIGVAIAVSIGDFKEYLDNQDYIEKTLTAVKKEIKLSQSELDTVLQRHYLLIESFENAIEDNDQSLGELISVLGGVQFPLIKNISLRFFISQKADLVDFELISRLLEIEEHTNVLSDKMKRLADFAYENINNTEEESKITFAYLLYDDIDSEETLMKSYTEFFKSLDHSFQAESK
jgi:hypothetical protein